MRVNKIFIDNSEDFPFILFALVVLNTFIHKAIILMDFQLTFNQVVVVLAIVPRKVHMVLFKVMS